jgi:hypothetical protein
MEMTCQFVIIHQKIQLLVNLQSKFATLPNCWNTLRDFDTKVTWKHVTGQEKTWVW